MSELQEIQVQDIQPSDEDKVRGLKSVCMRLGIMMIIVFLMRGAATILSGFIAPLLENMDAVAVYAIDALVSMIFLYAIPMTAAYLLLWKPRNTSLKTVYKKPVYFNHALGMFPAIYAVGISVNLLTMLVSLLFVNSPDINKSFNTVNELTPPNTAAALILFFQLTVIAPVFEEMWFRGFVMESLRPYGNGFAIFISGILFGITHGNLQQIFYATALGICLGYIAQTTKSIVTTTVMHAIFNSISGFILLFYSTPQVMHYMETMGAEGTDDPVVIALLVFLFFIIITLIVGLFMAIAKFRKIKKYRVEKVWEYSSARRWGIFLSRATVIIMLVLAIDTVTFRFITEFLYELVHGAA